MKRTGFAVAAALAALVVLMSLATAPPLSHASGKVHIVAKGDTLWDISSLYLYDPFLWPQIWNVNRSIENPHLIFPGQEVLIPEGVVRTAPPPREARPVLPAPPPETAPEPAPEPRQPEAVAQPEPLPEEVRQEMLLAMSTYGFIVDDAEIGIGTITSSEEKRLLISPGMKVYIETGADAPLTVERRYSIVRVFDKVQHPITKDEIGYLARVLGDVTVVQSRGRLATAIVGDVYKDARIGDHVIEHIDYLTWLPSGEDHTSPDLTGYVLINPEGKTILGKGDVVFTDLGIEDGVRTGDTLTLLGQPGSAAGMETPRETIGAVQVIVPRPGSSVARITESVRDIGIGTMVVGGR